MKWGRLLLAATPVLGNVFQKVIDELEQAKADALQAEQENDDLFGEVSCEQNKIIDGCKEKIPQLKKSIQKLTANIKKLRAANEKMSIEMQTNRALYVKLTAELAEKTRKRNEEHQHFLSEEQLHLNALEMLDTAIAVLMRGTAQGTNAPELVQIRALAEQKGFDKSQLAMLQTGAKSGNIIGVMNNMKDTFTKDLFDLRAEEKEALDLFNEYKERTETAMKTASDVFTTFGEISGENGIKIQADEGSLKADKEELVAQKDKLRTAEDNLKEHTEYHTKTAADSKDLLSALNSAINLLGSEETRNMMKGYNDNRSGRFIQVAAMAHMKFGWDAVYAAVDDIKKTLDDEEQEIDDKYNECVTALIQHAEAETSFKENLVAKKQEHDDAQSAMTSARVSIKNALETIETETNNIREQTELVKDTEATLAKDTAESNAAVKLMMEAIKLLSNYGGKDAGENPGEKGNYSDVSGDETIKKVTDVINVVIKDVKDQLKMWTDEAKNTIAEGNAAIAASKMLKTNSEEHLATSQKDLTTQTRIANSAQRHIDEATAGVEGEKSWWESAGKRCNEFTSQEHLRNASADGRVPLPPKDADSDGDIKGQYQARKGEIAEENKSLDAIKEHLKTAEGNLELSTDKK